MTNLTFHPRPSDKVTALRAGGPDAYGLAPEHATSNGDGMPCRYCLGNIPNGASFLILAHRPFGVLQPYAETGPIFLCADDCTAFAAEGLPPVLTTSVGYLLKGYTAGERICYGTGKIVPPADISAYATDLLSRDEIAFVDVRSASNNYFLTRITRA